MSETHERAMDLARRCIAANDELSRALVGADADRLFSRMAMGFQANTEALESLLKVVEELDRRLDFHDEVEAYGRGDQG